MKALVIEDDADVASILGRSLEAHGFSVLTAGDGERAVELGETVTFDLCVLDLNLPGISGLETLDLLRKHTDHFPPTIVLTGAATMEAAVESLRHGVSDFLSKPFDLAELLSAVDLALSRTRGARVSQKSPAAAATTDDGELLGCSPVMRALLERSRHAARSSVNILITGDTGTGKSLLARRIHRWSNRAAGRFVAISCAALPADLVESELFGHEKGAFTGATAKREGRFELASDGTLFLDEIGEMPLLLQPKLLRVLQSGEFEPIGSTRTVLSKARIIAAANRDLPQAIARGEFRQDLYFRLNVVMLHMPRLRERRDDIERLAISFARQCARTHGTVVEGIESAALAALVEFDWPGNVRQLRNTVERAVIFAKGTVLRKEEFELTAAGSAPAMLAHGPRGERVTSQSVPSDLALKQLERLAINKALADCGGSRRAAAERLGLSRSTLYRRLRAYRERDEGNSRRPAA